MVPTAGSTVTALILSVLCAGPPPQAISQDRQPPDFRVQIWGDVSAEFGVRIRSYAELRSELERGLPPFLVTEDAAAILGRTRALARRVHAARAQAKPGDIFTRDVRGEFRKALQTQTDAATCATLFDDNPGSIDISINGTYSARRPLSTMAPNVLAVLPRLPEDIEYRLAGRQLILLDTRAGVVVDRMTSAVLCRKGGVR